MGDIGKLRAGIALSQDNPEDSELLCSDQGPVCQDMETEGPIATAFMGLLGGMALNGKGEGRGFFDRMGRKIATWMSKGENSEDLPLPSNQDMRPVIQESTLFNAVDLGEAPMAKIHRVPDIDGEIMLYPTNSGGRPMALSRQTQALRVLEPVLDGVDPQFRQAAIDEIVKGNIDKVEAERIVRGVNEGTLQLRLSDIGKTLLVENK